MAFDWTDERCELLKSRWGDGENATTIARELGGDVSRCAVLGKVHRMGLSERRVKVRRVSPRPSKPRGTDGGLAFSLLHRSKPKLPIVQVATPEDASRAFGTPCALLDLTALSCRWPIGNGPYLFCNAVPLDSHPYCPHHNALAYTIGRERHRVAA